MSKTNREGCKYFKIIATIMVSNLLFLPNLTRSETTCQNHPLQLSSKNFYFESLVVHFETRILYSKVDSFEDAAGAMITTAKFRSSIASGIATVDKSPNILDLPEDSRLKGSNYTISLLKGDLISTTPIAIEKAPISWYVRNMEPFRVVPKDLAESDEVDRFKVEPKKFIFSKNEKQRQSSTQCTGNVFDNFERASLEVANLDELKSKVSWASVPQALMQLKKLPANPKDANFETIKKFENAYRKLIERCTTKNISPKISKAVGKLTIGGDVCTALRLGRRYIITSRHCLFDDWGRPKPISPLDIKFSYPAAKNTAPVCGIVRSRNSRYDPFLKEVTASNDFVILVIPEQDDSVEIDIMDSSKVRGGIDSPTELEVTGVWPGSSALGLAGRDDLLTYTGAFCLVVGPKAPKTAGCILHKCGTIAGGSGSPLMRRASVTETGKGLEIVALNRGEADSYASGAECTELPDGVEANNVATIISKEIIDELN